MSSSGETASRSFEQITNAVIAVNTARAVVASRLACDFVISSFPHRDYVRISVYKRWIARSVTGMIRMNLVVKVGLGVALSFMTRLRWPGPTNSASNNHAFLQPRPGRRQAEHGDLQVLRYSSTSRLEIFPLPVSLR